MTHVGNVAGRDEQAVASRLAFEGPSADVDTPWWRDGFDPDPEIEVWLTAYLDDKTAS